MHTGITDQIVLVVEDDLEVRNYLEMALRCEGFSVEATADGEEALSCLETGLPICAVLLDLVIPKKDGMQVLREIREKELDLPVIVVSGVASPRMIVAAMRAGASDFLPKPINYDSLRRAMLSVFEIPPRGEVKRVPKRHPPTLFFGSSATMRELEKTLDLVAHSEAPVLIQGETGAGKEMAARYLHLHSRRAEKTFVKLNCAALPSEVVESELFGYERGAFTGAFQRKPGMFEIADQGTLLLDEIGDMDFKIQAKLLQVLQDNEFQRLGGKETVRVDVRVIAATHNDLEKAVGSGTFRRDLYYRLNVISLHVRPLRELRQDIIPLAKFLLKKHSPEGGPVPEITPELSRALLEYPWPGNVRELENVIRKLMVLRDPALIVRDLTAQTGSAPARLLQTSSKPADSASITDKITRSQAEIEAILNALNESHWNRKRAASLLNIDYKGLLYKMKKIGIDANSSVDAPPLFSAHYKRTK